MCGTSGTVAAVTQVHCLCYVNCCLAVDQERLRVSSSCVDIRRLIKFHVLFGRISLECYRLLKEGLGTFASSYETVC